MNSCPSHQSLQKLLAEALAATDHDAIERHVENCHSCQETLAALTDDERPSDSALRTRTTEFDYLEKLKENPPTKTRPPHGNSDGPGIIAFPEPPTERGPLGRLDSYEIVAELGVGGFGYVYKAYDRVLKKEVALKILKPELATSDTELARFEREARKAAAVRHDHVVTIHRFVANGVFPLPFIVMEYIDGEPLGRRLRKSGVLPIDEAVRIVREAAQGLAAAHASNVVHRDVKPGNLMLEEPSGRVKITDFGLARGVDGNTTRLTQPGAGPGTPQYMSPEQILRPETIDARTDIYSLGVVLYELLIGEPPFRGLTHMVVHQVVNEEPRSLRRLNDRIPRDLETIVLKCLAKDCNHRYSSAEELAEDLRRFQEGETILARPAGPIEKTVKWVKRRPTAAALMMVGSLAAALLVAACVSLYYGSRLQNLNQNLLGMNTELEQSKHDLEHMIAHAQKLQYVTEMNMAQRVWQDGGAKRTSELLAKQPQKFRDFEWYYLKNLTQRAGENQFASFQGPVWSIALSRGMRIPDRLSRHRFVAAAGRQGQEYLVKIWDAKDKFHGVMAKSQSPIRQIAFSPTDELLAVACDDGLVSLWDARTKKRIRTIRNFAPVWALAFSHDGKYLATGDTDGVIGIWNAADFDRPLKTMRKTGAVLSLSFHRGGRHLAAAIADRRNFDSGEMREKTGLIKPAPLQFPKKTKMENAQSIAAIGRVAVWDIQSPFRPLHEFTAHDNLVRCVEYSPDGSLLATAGFDHTARLWQMGAKTQPQLLATLEGHQLEVMQATFSPDQRFLASSSWDKTVKIWDVATKKLVRTFRGHRGVVRALAISTIGTLFTGDERGDNGEIKIWNTHADQDCISLDSPLVLSEKPFLPTAGLTPNGEAVLTVDQNRVVQVWDARTFKLAAEKKSKARPAVTTAADPNGQWIAYGEFDVVVLQRKGSTFHAHELGFHMGRIEAFAFSPNSRLLASSDGKHIILWDLRTRKRLQSLNVADGIVAAMAFRPDGEQMAFITGNDDGGGKSEPARTRGKLGQSQSSIHLWTPKTGEVVSLAPKKVQRRNPAGIAFSPDGRHLASANMDYTITVWDLKTQMLVKTFHGHMCHVFTVAFRPDGKRLASGSEDWTVKIWDFETALPLMTLRGHNSSVRQVHFSAANGEALLSVSDDGAVRVWQAPKR